jgi:hypothetical protein
MWSWQKSAYRHVHKIKRQWSQWRSKTRKGCGNYEKKYLMLHHQYCPWTLCKLDAKVVQTNGRKDNVSTKWCACRYVCTGTSLASTFSTYIPDSYSYIVREHGSLYKTSLIVVAKRAKRHHYCPRTLVSKCVPTKQSINKWGLKTVILKCCLNELDTWLELVPKTLNAGQMVAVED